MASVLPVRVTTGSTKPAICGWRTGADGREELEVRVAEVPADGRANETPSSDVHANDSQGKCLRVDRGGSWMFPAWLLRPATRERNPADFRAVIMGFRVARNLP